jgi:hypothetical protein
VAFDLAACPVPLQDNAVNAANHLDTIAKYGLGPADPTQPNDDFWAAKGELWGITAGDARGRLCANCIHYFDTTPIRDCIENGPAWDLKASALPLEPKWADIESHPVAYCDEFDITCSPTRTCDDQEMGGPIDDVKAEALDLPLMPDSPAEESGEVGSDSPKSEAKAAPRGEPRNIFEPRSSQKSR